MTQGDFVDETMVEPQVPPRYDGEAAIDLSPEEEVRLGEVLAAELRHIQGERGMLVERTLRAERKYNLNSDADPVYADTELIQVPASTARVDKVSSELSGAFDRDGAPIYTAIPNTNSMVEHAQHAERMFHHLLKKADMIRPLRTTIRRAVKVGTGVMCSEIVSRPIARPKEEPLTLQGMMVQQDQPRGEGEEFENVLVVRSVKVQDMYVAPMNIGDITEASFVGERFQLPKWMFDDALTEGFYSLPFDEAGEMHEIRTGYHDDSHGMVEEQQRVGFTAPGRSGEYASEFYDLIRGWVRHRPVGERRHELYYVVFPVSDPSKLLRCKKSPYESLDRVPYTFWCVDEGDGSMFGRGYMELLEDMQDELNDLHALRVEGVRRAYSKIWITRKGSAIADTIQQRRNAKTPEDDGSEERPEDGVATINADEVFETENPQQDIVGITLTEANPQYRVDEQNIMAYMDMATVDNSPLQGIRTAFEVRQAASEGAAKLGGYLKIVASTGLRPQAEIIRAMVWDYLMPVSDLSDDIRMMEYGDTKFPITKTDYFNGFSLEPSGTTTSADQMVAITNTASLISEFVPLIVQMPGLVPDPARAVREILKARARALGLEEFETVFGLSEPTPDEVQKAIMYRQLIMGISQQGQAPGFQMPGNIMGAGEVAGGAPLGGNGGAVQGPPDLGGGAAFAGPQEAAQQDGGNLPN